MRFRDRVEKWVASAKANERRYVLAGELRWIIDTSTTEQELLARIREAVGYSDLELRSWERGRTFQSFLDSIESKSETGVARDD